MKSTATSKFITTYPSLIQMRAGAIEAATSANPGLAAGVLTPANRCQKFNGTSDMKVGKRRGGNVD